MSPRQELADQYAEAAQQVRAAAESMAALGHEAPEAAATLSDVLQQLDALEALLSGAATDLPDDASLHRHALVLTGAAGAGKSTILESLSILLDEPARRALLHDQRNDLRRFEAALNLHSERVRSQLDQACQWQAQTLQSAMTGSTAVVEAVQRTHAQRLRSRTLWSLLGGLILGAALSAGLTWWLVLVER